MKRTKLHRFVSIVAVALAIAREVSAQVVAPAPIQGQIAESDRFARPLSQREWIRGYRFGHDQGFWSGVRDARAALSPSRFMLPSANMRLTPYHHGYMTGFIEGYRKGFVYIW